ncbi:MAG: AAA family ATPase [Deltaproteobacteria bacterium]|nr:AAA family ATPase [Deltaproteobacteria bacterium]
MTAELTADELRGVCGVEMFQFTDTSELDPLDEVIGQERAVQAIDFGLNMKSPGYNIFVTGIAGTGKSTIVKEIIGKFAAELPAPDDWCMVNNFKDEYCPKAIRIPSGKAVSFSKSIHRLIDDLKTELPKAFESKLAQDKISEIQNAFVDQQKALLEKVEVSANQKQIRISRDESGYQPVPYKNGKPVSEEEFQAFSLEIQSEIEENLRKVQIELEAALREINKLNQIIDERVEAYMEEVTRRLLQDRLQPLQDPYIGNDDILSFLQALEDDVVENLDRFVTFPGEDKDSPDDAESDHDAASFFLRYRVNILVEQKSEKGAPVIFETNPTYSNVIGRIEKRAYMGAVTTDFTLVQAGALLKACGGYLMMEIEPLLLNPNVWDALKRSLQNKSLSIEDVPSDAGSQSASLRPELIPLEVKVILLGNYEMFESLQNFDFKFNKIFRVRADFDDEVALNSDSIQKYARFIARICKAEKLLPFTPDAVAAVVEYGKQSIADKTRLSLRFGPIVALLKEADYWAQKDASPRVTGGYVSRALNEYWFRYNLYEEKIHESYMDGTVLLDVTGSVSGQVNALAVYQIGDISFGRPSRITAETFMGKSGVINIERETHLSGSAHDKGVLILSGYLGKTFAQLYPLSLTISIAFEQNYGVIDGDSASSSELYAVISSLSDVPIFQGIAVTGSVNQKGEIQAIGDVNEKIEGFYDVCKTRGLTSRQGVMIPAANVNNLMLKPEVVEAVRQNLFHVYPVSTISEGIEILTGMPAGTTDSKGIYPETTVYGRVQIKLKTFLKRSMAFSHPQRAPHAPVFYPES